ncbi:class I SAM-dependent methyltransferase [Bacillus sp. FJAT-50079]|uniref:SAM-dependent methyltransferase n=1 Tax=Bacillus sp. FJAT-50079 TaxID=2833577 RepID=UPI001BC99A9B|nr:class I SAM-dependent methyltransferase [Bacillus sp. FJAT-50079]MBS4207047.1 class I SAM-dependent methyltransferase [Bacillus sp. FJAT-50079]
MPEATYERRLRIRTSGLREWRKKVQYNRYEATPYKALEELFKGYKLEKTDRVVDYGCGRGRVSFYVHHHFQIQVTGIEVNELTYSEALDNKTRYRQRARHIAAPLRFDYGLAEHYQVEDEDNVFYFFNPFSVQIFKKVVQNILQSVQERRRPVDIILYYPMPEFKRYLKSSTPFKLMNKIRVPGAHDSKEKFLIYRFS